MRLLQQAELGHVSGGTYSCGCYCPPSNNQPGKGGKQKNNNGYGNGPESGRAPGNSGSTGGGKNQNFGPRGPR